jgi:mannose-6-phosphate isomerase-like protein (cupin superfamily)
MKTGDHIDKPWGWEQILDLNDKYCIKHLFLNTGHRLSLQYHERKTETLMLVEGGVELTIGRGSEEQVLAMAPMRPYPIAPGTIHRLKGQSPDGGLILEVSTLELDDVVRLDDDYGRAGT